MFLNSGHRILLLSLIFIFGIGLGALVKPVRIFLNQQADNINDFIVGHPLEPETSAWQKIQNDLGLAPWRSTRDPSFAGDFDYQTIKLSPELKDILPESSLELFLDQQADAISDLKGMLIKTQVDTGRGYSPQLLLIGFDGFLHKLIPLDAESDCDCSSKQPLNYFHLAGDPAEIRVSGNSLVNLDSCGQIQWSVDSKYTFHHYLNNDGDHKQIAFWVLDATDLVQVETHTGRVLDRISLTQIINANPDLPVFESRLKGTKQERWEYGKAEFAPIARVHTDVENADKDPFHTNDIDEYLGSESGLFERGDLVLSFRSLNLILVVRPATHRIVWYAYGLTSRQHDPDFVSANSIMIYDNNFHNQHSRVVLLEAAAGEDNVTEFTTRSSELVNRIDDKMFHQLIEGYQFPVNDSRSLIVSAESYNAGIDLSSGKTFFAFRHQWREEAFLAVDIERLLGPDEFDQIKNASCQ